MDKYSHRYIARVILQAETPLFVGSGETSLLKDALVQRDVHSFPMIQGTSLAGVLRHSLEDFEPDVNKWNSFFGFQNGAKGEGSKLKISSAYLVLENGKVAEGLKPNFELDKYKKPFENLPSRQHVRINEKGVADTKNKGLFDNEVVYKGCRFLFEIELKGDANDSTLWAEFLNQFKSPLFRVGQGTRNGYGDLSVNECYAKVFNLNVPADFDAYLNFDNSLNAQNVTLGPIDLKKENMAHYTLVLKPENFFMFGAGYGDDEVDNIPVTEDVISYDSNYTLQVPVKQTLIPASSIKGALSHRTAFHYNKSIKRYANNYANEIKENTRKLIEFVETQNDAVYELFGAEEGNKQRAGTRGKVIINDILLDEKYKVGEKIFNHVAIDRFTGGAMDGALFSEKVSYFEDENQSIEVNIFVEKLENQKKDLIIDAFEDALKDVCKGLLPLGGMTTKGHGIFTGSLIKNGMEVKI